MFVYINKTDNVSYDEIIGNALFFLLIGAFLYGNYIVGKVASDSNKISGPVHVIRIVIFTFIAATILPFTIYRQAGELAKFLPSLSVAGFLVGLASGFFTRKSS